MNDEYLWNKTGDDAEIRKLEETLAVFSYELDTAPFLPVPDVAAKSAQRSPWPWLRLAFAAPAAIALAGTVWLWIGQEREVAIGTVEIETVIRPGQEAVQTEEAKDGTVRQDTVSNRMSGKPRNSRLAVVRRTPQVRNKRMAVRPALTSEEKYAYEKLMLALSITGSKLKIVRDTINGSADTDRSDKR